MAVRDWLLSLSMFLRSLRLVACVCTSFLFMAVMSIVWSTVNPPYSKILRLQICLLAKILSVIPKSIIWWLYVLVSRAVKIWVTQHSHSQLKLNKVTLPSCFCCHAGNKSFSWSVLCFFWWFRCLEWPISMVLKHHLMFLNTRRLWCALRRNWELNKVWVILLLAMRSI